MKKRIFSALAAILALSMIGGCSDNGGSLPADGGQTSSSSIGSADTSSSSSSSSTSSSSTPQSSSTESLPESSSENGSSSESSAPVPVEVSSTAGNVDIPPVEITADNMRTSVKLFDVISEGKDNAMLSPLSLNMALGLIDAGAAGSTKTALDTYLGSDDYSGFASEYMEVVESQYNFKSDYIEEWKNVFEIANSFWANKDLPFKEEYKSGLTEKFKAEVRNIDFGDKDNALKTINGWVSDKTHKMIPTIINDYSDDIAAVLINTIYFESAWRDEWTINEDYKQLFTLPDGSTKELPLMHNGVRSYFENDKATAFSCGYMNGLEFIGILPKETGDFTVESLDIPSLLESESYEYDVVASMPKLEFETEIPLTETLKSFSLSEIFDENAADFSGMSDVPMYVSEILQKTKLELDENGTKAAAVTMATMQANGIAMEREKKEVTLDRSFAFLIYDRAENQIVFLGKVTNP
ncbi:MAG: serpin family protein [Oscillospiraceae bacterium]|nr:serpin family protein [Oscillospiraceae bacterium]